MKSVKIEEKCENFWSFSNRGLLDFHSEGLGFVELALGKRELSFSITIFTGVWFYCECLVVWGCCFLWAPQLFSGIVNISFKAESVLMMGDIYWGGLYPAHCRPLNVMLVWWEAPVVFRALKKKVSRLPGKQMQAVHESNNTSLKWKAQTCFLTYLNFAVYFWCWDFLLLPTINFLLVMLQTRK